MNADKHRWGEEKRAKNRPGLARGALLLLFTFQVSSFSLCFADIHYVDIGCTNAVAPYTNWVTAATVIQDAIDQAESNDTVLVADGVYSNGWKVMYGSMTNRVAINKAITVQSVNGPGVTVIKGKGPVGNGAVRCAYVTNGAVLAGFTLTNGATRSSGDITREWNGGGVWCESGGVVSNCVIENNSASSSGGGSFQGILYNCMLNNNSTLSSGGGSCGGSLYNCTLSGNTASTYGGGSTGGNLYNCILSGNNAVTYGGGCSLGNLYNCTVSGNNASQWGGGSYQSSLVNCILYFNTAAISNNWYGGFLYNSCTTPLPPGTGNITNDPQLVGTGRIASSSPCRGKGNWSNVRGVDMDGEGWLNPPSMGCDEYVAGAITGALSVTIQAAYTNAAVGCAVGFRSFVEGKASRSEWSYGDGTVESNAVWVSHGWTQTGEYAVVVAAFNESWPGGVSATVKVTVVSVPDYYVNVSNSTPAYPYTSWGAAATGIQDAVDAAIPGGVVWVSNGVYATGGRAVFGAMTNRVVLDKQVVVKSVNGPGVTVIKGRGPAGNSAIRCAYVTNGALLAGFTLTNGATRSSGDEYKEHTGGGVWCENSGVVSNCVMVSNSAYKYGGGSKGGVLYNCTLSGNSISGSGGGGGSYQGVLYNCTLSGNTNSTAISGGGSYDSVLYNCTLIGNSTPSAGGGSYGGCLYNCTLIGNTAFGGSGGGSYKGSLFNCTLNGNSASAPGGGSSQASLYNCIVYFNTAPSGNNWDGGTFSNSCTTPLPSGTGNITNDPQLVDLWRIASSSPCRGKGNGAMATGTDMDGDAWLNPPSMGCDEYVAGGLTGALSVTIQAAYTNVATGCQVEFKGSVEGKASRSEWNYGDGSMGNSAVWVSHGWTQTGEYAVVFTAFNESWPGGVSATVKVTVVSVPEYYVYVSNSTPVSPFASWETAATGIQTAVDVAIPGGIVWVTNGVYESGGRAVFGTMTNRVALNKPVVVRSVNGPGVTVIKGIGPVGNNAIRCAYVTNGALLAGFTLTNGATRSGGDDSKERSGGGVWCETGGVVSNCVIVSNAAVVQGGGSYRGILYDCTLIGNSGSGSCWGSLYNCTLSGNTAGMGGGNFGGSLSNCTLSGNTASYGGGCSRGTLFNCTLSGNTASSAGGGSYESTLYNCTLIGNSAPSSGGGGSSYGILYNCTLRGNTAISGGGSHYGSLYNCTLSGNTASSGTGGGCFGGSLYNCIVYFNTAPSKANYEVASLSCSCTTPMPSGTGNITNNPQFVDTNAANYRLKLTSPCIDKGGNQDWMYTSMDLDGNPRVLNGKVDMGAYETAFYTSPKVWLQGAYDTNQDRMTTALSNNIPLSSPYKADARVLSSIPSNVTDWVLVQLRETNWNTIVSRSAFVNRDGYVLADNGSTGLVVDVSPGTNCYLVLQHRNHLAVMSAQPLAFTNILTTYDFTTNASCYYGGSNAAVQLEPGAWGMAAGDADGDGKITETDRKIVEQQKGRSGYLPGDLNLDGVVE